MLAEQSSVTFAEEIPVNYDSFLGPMFFEPFALDMAERIHQISPASLLELACGTGVLTKRLPFAVKKGGLVTATDISRDMIKYAKEKIKNENIKWFVVDAVALPFADETFDCIVVQFGVMFFSDRIEAFREAYRILKPGGTLIFSCWDQMNNNPMPRIVDDLLYDFFPVNTPPFYSTSLSYYEESVIENDLLQADFKNVEFELLKLTGYSESANDAATGLVFGTPTVIAIEDRDPEQLPLIMDLLEKQITKRFGATSLEVPLQAHVVKAIK